MKKINIFLLIIMLVFFGCNKNDDAIPIEVDEPAISILGTWLYIAGRDSNDFPPFPDELPFIELESENTVTFFADSTIVSNSVSLCINTHLLYNSGTSGIYTLIDSTYTSNDCPNPERKYQFTQTDSILIISYPYNGISESKFKKISDL